MFGGKKNSLGPKSTALLYFLVPLLAKLGLTQVLDSSKSRNFTHPESECMQPALLRGLQRALGAAEETAGVVHPL